MSEMPSAGWYQRPTVPEEDRYWDGEQWTDRVRDHVTGLSQEPMPQEDKPVAAAMPADPPPSPAVSPTAAQQTVAQYTDAASGAMQKALGSDVVRQRRGELFVGGGSFLLLVSLLMPWFTLNVNGANVPGSSPNAFETRGLMYLVLVVVLAIISYLIFRTGWGNDRSRLANWRLLVGATGFNLLVSLFCFLAVPGGHGVSSSGAEAGLEFSAKYQWSYGGFIGVAAAIIAFVGALRVRKERKDARQRALSDIPPTS